MVGTAVSVNSFTVNIVFSTTKTIAEVNSTFAPYLVTGTGPAAQARICANTRKIRFTLKIRFSNERRCITIRDSYGARHSICAAPDRA